MKRVPGSWDSGIHAGVVHRRLLGRARQPTEFWVAADAGFQFDMGGSLPGQQLDPRAQPEGAAAASGVAAPGTFPRM